MKLELSRRARRVIVILLAVLLGGGAASAADGPPVNSSPPVISGTAQARHTLTVSPGSWSGSEPMVFSYQWQHCVDYSQAVLDAQPVGYWRLGESAGAAAADASGNGHTGTYSFVTLGSPGFTCLADPSVGFEGGSGRINTNVTVPHTGALAFDRTTPFSLEAWAKATPTRTFLTLWEKGYYSDGDLTAGASYGFGLRPADGRFEAWLQAPAIYPEQRRLSKHVAVGTPLDTWNHYAVTYDGSGTLGGLRMYVNGVERSASISWDTLGTGSVASTRGATIGVREGEEVSPGDAWADELAVYAGVLSPERVGEHFELGSTRAFADIAGAVADQYRISDGDTGKHIRVRVAAVNAAGTTNAVSFPTSFVAPVPFVGAPINVVAPRIVGIPKMDNTLTVDAGVWGGAEPFVFHYQWRRCPDDQVCVDIPGARGSTYAPTNDDVATSLRVQVTALNSAGSAAVQSATSERVFALYSYLRAAALGYHVPPTAAQTGLPVCIMSSDPSGFATAEELEVAIAAAPDDPICTPDPTGVIIGVGLPVHHASGDQNGYHLAGALTSSRQQGGRITVEVGDPDIQHTGRPDEFLSAWVMAKEGSGELGPWLEVGWIEDSETTENPEHPTWRADKPYVFTEAMPPGNPRPGLIDRKWNIFLQPGNYYSFRVRDCLPFEQCRRACMNADVCAEFFCQNCEDGRGNRGSWIAVGQSHDFRCVTADGVSNCFIEEILEMWSQIGTHRQAVAYTDGPGVNFKNTLIRTAPNNWVSWDEGSIPTYPWINDDPYFVCPQQNYSAFRVGKSIQC